MPKLRCNANNCQYNYNEKCTRNSISVGDCYKSHERQVECKSFKPGNCLLNNEFAKDVSLYEMDNISISCEAKDCIYNLKEKCTVSMVDIQKPKTCCDCVNAECTTYKK